MKRERRYKNQEENEGTPEWMLTYSDLVTLLLTFFIMLFSMANVDKQKFEEIAFSLQSAFLNISNGENFSTNKGKDIVKISPKNNLIDNGKLESNNDPDIDKMEALKALDRNARKLEDVKKKIEEAIEKRNLTEYIKIVDEKHSLILRFDSVILFDLGSADIKASSTELLKELGAMFRELDNNIIIKGHTDNLPINTTLFPSNWELSTKRATNVVVFLVNNCDLDPQKLTAAGKGEFEPIKPNDTEENRQKNRRIDIEVDKYIIE